MITALYAWVLTMTLTREDIRTGVVFPTEKECVHAGEKWLDDATEYARRNHNPPPKGVDMHAGRRQAGEGELMTKKLSRVAAKKAQCAQDAVAHLEGCWVVTVCDYCHRASCWQGEFYCANYKTAGTKRITIDEAKAANLEHPTWWTKDGEVIQILLAKGIYA